MAADTPVLSDYGTETYGQPRADVLSLAEVFDTPFWANFYANELKTLENAYSREASVEFAITVVAQDNWAMVALPCELFVEWADAIRSRSPFDHTIVATLAGGWNGYVPTREAFTRPGGYETKDLSSTMLAPEAGDMVLAAVLDMLERVKPERP